MSDMARKWVGDDHDWNYSPAPSLVKPEAETTDPKIRKLYGPNGQVLRTFSNRPPVGFHQGERSKS